MDDSDINIGSSDSEDTFDLDLDQIPALTTADIQPLTMANIGNIDLTGLTVNTVTLNGSYHNGWTTIPSSGSVYTVGVGAGGGGGGGGIYNQQNHIWQSHAINPAVQIKGDADIEGNLTVGGVNIVDMLAKIQERLAILVPNPDRLEKYEALKMAYEHYKTLEALCVEESNPPEKK
jgi:hypothetical protein